jgi:hypothetical protein
MQIGDNKDNKMTSVNKNCLWCVLWLLYTEVTASEMQKFSNNETQKLNITVY